MLPIDSFQIGVTQREALPSPSPREASLGWLSLLERAATTLSSPDASIYSIVIGHDDLQEEHSFS